jgi:hypothetical protein
MCHNLKNSIEKHFLLDSESFVSVYIMYYLFLVLFNIIYCIYIYIYIYIKNIKNMLYFQRCIESNFCK